MDPIVAPLVWLIIGVTLVALVRLGTKRRASIEAGRGAFRLSLEVHGGGAPHPEGPFPLFAADPGVRESILSQGDVETFDYRCDRGEAGFITARRTCAVGPLPAWCPPLSIGRRGEAGPPTALLPEVHFEAAVFNDQVQVRCADGRFAHVLVDERMMEWLLLLPMRWGIQVADDRALVHGPVTDPWKREPVIQMLEEFRRRVPSSLASLYPRS